MSDYVRMQGIHWDHWILTPQDDFPTWFQRDLDAFPDLDQRLVMHDDAH